MTPNGQGNLAVGNALFQSLKEPTGVYRAGAGDRFADARWSTGTQLLSGDDLRGFSGWLRPGRFRQRRFPTLGAQSNLPTTLQLTAAGVLVADTEGVVTSHIARQLRIRLDRDNYRELSQEVLRRDGWRCQQCGSSKDLQIHQMRPRSQLGGDVEANLITVCSVCHREIHFRVESPGTFDRDEE